MAKFLTGSNLSDEIRKVVNGNNVRCAVAFWGNGSMELFGNSMSKLYSAKIICDISMGCTSDVALKKLKAPENINLKHYNNFHSKFYISDIGAIVTSANASNNGIGFLENSPKLEEAGVFLSPTDDKQAYNDIEERFDIYFNEAKNVDLDTLKLAEKNWEKRKAGNRSAKNNTSKKTGSLISLIKSNPEMFTGIGFGIFTNPIDKITKDKAQKIAKKQINEINVEKSTNSSKMKASEFDVSSYCYNNSPSSGLLNDTFPSKFISFYVARKKLYMRFYERIIPTIKMTDPDDEENMDYYVSVSKKLPWSELLSSLGGKLINSNPRTFFKNKTTLEVNDFTILKRLAQNEKHVFSDAFSFRQTILEAT